MIITKKGTHSFVLRKITMEEKDLKKKKVAELRELAEECGIKGYEAMRKAQLIEALAEVEEREPSETSREEERPEETENGKEPKTENKSEGKKREEK